MICSISFIEVKLIVLGSITCFSRLVFSYGVLYWPPGVSDATSRGKWTFLDPEMCYCIFDL